MPRPTASIVIAAHQAEETIERSVRSVLAQSGIGAGLEVIVVDDGSTDRTRELVAAMAADEIPGRIVLASEAPNAGPSVARNRGLELARGHWIGFLDADDEFQPDFLERMLAASRCEPAADVVACAHQIVQAGAGKRRRPWWVCRRSRCPRRPRHSPLAIRQTWRAAGWSRPRSR